MAYQTRDVVDAMQAGSGRPVTELRVDGGAAVMDLLLRLQADLLGVRVVRAAVRETTALGAAWLAGLAEGVWGSLDELAACWQLRRLRRARRRPPRAEAAYQGWLRAVERVGGQPPTGAGRRPGTRASASGSSAPPGSPRPRSSGRPAARPA